MISRGAELLHLHRLARNLTQAELGVLFGVRRPWSAVLVCSWETGRTRPSRRRRARLEQLSSGFIKAAAWDQPPEATPVAQESLTGEAPSLVNPTRSRVSRRRPTSRPAPHVDVLEGQTSLLDLFAATGKGRSGMAPRSLGGAR